MSIAKRIRGVRELLGLSQKELATKLKISESSYVNLEDDSNPRYSSLARFCDGVGISLSFLVSDDLPITEENFEFFAIKKSHSFLLAHERMRQKVEVFEEMISNNPEALSQRKRFLG